MKDVLLPGLALAAAHAGDLDTLQAFVELVSSPLRDQASGWDAAHRAEHPPQVFSLMLLSHTGQWGLHPSPRALLEDGVGVDL